jgi:dinuclear metal center YbgI/SA1388 family protein
MIVSHHPLLFHGLKQIGDNDYVQRAAVMAIKNDIAIVSMHTNLDNVEGGVNSEIARRLGVEGEVTEGLFVGELAKPLSAEEYIYNVKKIFNTGVVMTNGLLKRPIKRIAICGGAGAFMLERAIKEGADAFLTGEMKYNDYFDHEGIQITVIGHYESEQFTKELLKDIIDKGCPGIRTIVTENNTNPIKYF